jgi:hypothetical protein
VTIEARRSVTLDAISAGGSGFTAGAPSKSLPASLAAGESVTVPVTFAPQARGAASGELRVSTSAGVLRSALSGVAVVAALEASSTSLRLEAAAAGGFARAIPARSSSSCCARQAADPARGEARAARASEDICDSTGRPARTACRSMSRSCREVPTASSHGCGTAVAEAARGRCRSESSERRASRRPAAPGAVA